MKVVKVLPPKDSGQGPNTLVEKLKDGRVWLFEPKDFDCDPRTFANRLAGICRYRGLRAATRVVDGAVYVQVIGSKGKRNENQSGRKSAHAAKGK